jgi:hypothetical protein
MLRVTRGEPVVADVLDVSIGGMLVKMPAARFSEHQPITVEFSFPRGGPVQHWHASVTHITDGTLGLMFDNFKSSELATLIELLHTAEDHARAVAQSVPPGFPNSAEPAQATSSIIYPPPGGGRS